MKPLKLAVYGTLIYNLLKEPQAKLICDEAILTQQGYLLDYKDYPAFIVADMIPNLYKAYRENSNKSLLNFLKKLNAKPTAYLKVKVFEIDSPELIDKLDDYEGGMFKRVEAEALCLDSNRIVNVQFYRPALLDLNVEHFDVVEPKELDETFLKVAEWEVRE